MSEPVAERIMQLVKARMSSFTTSHRSTHIATWQPKDLEISIHQGDIEHNEELSYAGNPPVVARDLPAIVRGIVKPSDSETTAVDTYKNRFWAEIVKAACDADLWHQWGGLAINTVVGEVEGYTAEDGSVSGVQVTLLITFRTDENNPFNVRA
jgi:hypothetical protein